MPKDNRQRNIIIIVAVVVLLCICCSAISVGWYLLGPAVMEEMSRLASSLV
ncbi:MAG: hypothetical protein KDE04_09040 [Anaerolineales bacterium]|nr:hypothetical protein [Anaerolineales bacterium]MCB0014348.1 hypothetical protein [Anaerolineales bacterium]MCB8960368.1 hypothetical protein [Ardenticatenales bacterium]